MWRVTVIIDTFQAEFPSSGGFTAKGSVTCPQSSSPGTQLSSLVLNSGPYAGRPPAWSRMWELHVTQQRVLLGLPFEFLVNSVALPQRCMPPDNPKPRPL